MVRRRISEAQRWQIIDMHTTGMSFKAIGRRMGYHYTVVSRLARKHTQTNHVKDLPRPQLTSDRDEKVLQRLVRRMPFATSLVLKQHWVSNRRVSTKTVRHHLKSAGLKSRRVIKRPLLVTRHRRTRLTWCLARRGLNLKTWRKIHWSDESRFLLHVTDGRIKVCRHKKYSLYPKEHPANCPLRWRLSNGLGVYLSWLQAGFSHAMQGNLTGNQYIRDILLLSPISTTTH
jgi:transposase